MVFRSVPALTLFLFCLPPCLAQRGDKAGVEMPEIWKSMQVPDAAPKSPAEAMKTFRVDPAFRLELVASEPLVEDPVAITWDADGRLWAVEMRGYMPDVDGNGEDARVGRIVVLEDTDGDGRMDRSTVFLDQLQMPRAIAMVQGGVLVAEPPHLWYCQDTTGDLKCDKKTRVADYAKLGPVEHTENGLVPALDNWIYSAKSSRRFRFIDGKIIEEPTFSRGQWGIVQDDRGRLYYNSNSSYLHADLHPFEYYARNPGLPALHGLGTRVVSDQSVWTIRVNPGINRGYEKSMLLADGRLARTTAVSGLAIYRGNRYPAAYHGNAFVPEPAGNVVSRFVLSDDNGTVKGEKKLTSDPDWKQREFLASTDERFRPVSVSVGPDGCLYVVDMYRGILQHKIYVTTFLRKQILERGLDKPLGLGRIYRLVPVNDPGVPPAPRLASASADRLVETLGHPDGWHRDTAQRLLVERRDPQSIQPLRQAACSANPHTAVHALWTLHGLDALDVPTFHKAAQSASPWVRAAALRTGEKLLKGPEAAQVFPDYARAAESSSEELRLQAAFSLGETAEPLRAQADLLLARMLSDAVEDKTPSAQILRAAVLSSSRGREIHLLELLPGQRSANRESAGFAAVLKDFSHAVFQNRRPDDVLKLLAIMAGQASENPRRTTALLEGATGVLQKKYPPLTLAQAPTGFEKLQEDPRFKAGADKLRSVLSWPGAQAAAVAQARELTPEEQQRFDKGRLLYMTICMACHQIHGEGNAGMAPTLVDSDWVTGDEKRLTRIVLNGLMGPIIVNGQEWNLVMPGVREIALFDDEGVASVLTYIRREWGNEADPVSPETVKKIRQQSADRRDPWTAEELEKLDAAEDPEDAS